jgi:hypothetical protein
VRFAAVEDSEIEDAPLDTVRITHDEEGALTLAWRDHDDNHKAATILYASKAKFIKQLRRAVIESDKQVKRGPATPRVTTWDRIRRQRRR